MFRYDSSGHTLSASPIRFSRTRFEKVVSKIQNDADWGYFSTCRSPSFTCGLLFHPSSHNFKLHHNMKRSQDHLTRNMMLDPVTQTENHIVESWKQQVFNARNRDYESKKYHQHDQLSRNNISRRVNVITRNDRNMSPPAVQCGMNIANSWKHVSNETNNTDEEREYQQYHLSRKRRLDNADSQSRGSSTTRRMSNIFEQKNNPSMNDELLKNASGRANINIFGKVKVTFNVYRISKHRDQRGRRKARIRWRKLVYLLPYNEILFLQNRHAIQRLQKGLLGKEALTKGTTANRHHWRDQITNRDIHLILENEY